MQEYLENNPTDIAIICTTRTAAKKLANFVVKRGVGAIWNFSNEDLALENKSVIVENINLADSLLVLKHYIKKQKK